MKKSFLISFSLSLLVVIVFANELFAQGVLISAGGKIEATGSASIDISNGSFTNNGTYTKDTDTIIFSGTTAGEIRGSVDTDFHDIIVSNTGGITTNINATANNVSVNSGASLDISAGKKVSIAGVLTNSSTDDGVTVISDASGEGELQVTGTASGNVTYQRYLTHSEWHLIAAPLADMSINTYVTNAGNSIATNSAKYGLAPYDNTVPGWNHYNSSGDNLASAAGNFVSGKGYETLRATSSGTVDIVGTVVTSDVSIGVTQNANSWNLIGNPFSTSLNGNDDAHATNNFLTINTADLHDSYEAIYIWDPQNGYQTINHVYASNTAFYIAPGQAFFVYSVAGGGTIDFTEVMQSDATGTFYKKNVESEDFSVRLKLSAESREVSTQIYYLDHASAGLDPGYDAGRFTGGDNSFAIYSHLAGDSDNMIDFDIQCLELGEYDLEIPLGVTASEGLNLIFSAEINANSENIPVIIEDRKLGVFTYLNDGETYTVTIPDSENGVGRFYLHNGEKSASGISEGEDQYRIVVAPSYQLIKVLGQVNSAAEIKLFDISGSLIFQKRLEQSAENEIRTGELQSGVYVVSIWDGVFSYQKKIIWIN